MLTVECVESFIISRQARGLSPNTIRWYNGILLRFAYEYPALPRCPEDIEQFLSRLTVGDERKHGYYRAIRAFYRFLLRRRRNPSPMETIDPPRRIHKQPGVLMPYSLNRLLNYRHPPKIKAVLLFLVDTGCRLGEVASLPIDMLHETPWGFTATIKGKTGTRTVPISYVTYHAMIINLPIYYSTHRLGRLISMAFKYAGVEGTAHTLRHTFATLWQGDELVLQQIMGHAHLSTTQLYRHLRTEFLSRQHRQFSPLQMVLSTSKSML